MRVNFSRVKQALKDLENHASYYVGGSLCIDFKDMPCVVLNRNGKGWSYRPNSNQGRFKFVVTREMQDLIEQAYFKHKVLGL